MSELKDVEIGCVPLVGMEHCLAEDEWPHAERALQVGLCLDLYRDPTNIVDKDAIKVVLEETQLGWIPRVSNKCFARLMDGNLQLHAVVEVIKPRPKRVPGEPFVWINIMWTRKKTEAELAEEVKQHVKRKKRRAV